MKRDELKIVDINEPNDGDLDNQFYQLEEREGQIINIAIA